ncbi:golgin subfamily A member 2-like [Perognathus longimembris pacificus]|uniref:golgin subfamily A member 2-like n=1 Tax=Perognathus longimembris pacificus TaxID=214514 RepID=UPI002019CAA9|nr:golgin subfamily A member 2-like [Perognathus longimembris pacificus]
MDTASTKDQDADISLNTMAELESLKHLSEKLTSFVSDTTLTPDRETLPCSEQMQDLEELYEGLTEALDACCQTNIKLAKKVKVLEKNSRDDVNELHQVKAYHQNILKENDELRKDLQLHKQTIEILVSQKNDLYTQLTTMQQAATHNAEEMRGLSSHLQSSQRRVAELEAVLSAISSQKEEEKEHTRELTREKDSLTVELEKTNKSMEELREYNATLEERLQMALLEKATMEHGMEELQKKLATSNIIQLQCSGLCEHTVSPQALAQATKDKEQLESQVGALKEELENMATQLQVNNTLSQQNLLQEEQLQALEQASNMCAVQAEDRLHQTLDTLSQKQSTIRGALEENQHLQNQLAELQSGFVRLSGDNMELASTLQAEENTKKQLAKQLEQLKQKVLQGSRELQTVQENLQQTQEQLLATRQQNQQLQAQMSLLAVPGGSEMEEKKDEEAARLHLPIPENVQSPEDLIAFLYEAQTSVDAEKARLGQQLRQQKLRCQYLAQLAEENNRRPEQEALATQSGRDCISQEMQGITRHIENLTRLFKEDLQVKTFLKEQVEDLELLCMQLRGEVDSIRDDTAFYGNHLVLLEKRQREKNECIAQLDQDTQRMVLELQDLLFQLQFQAASQNLPAKPTSGPPKSESACEDEFEDIDLNSDVEPAGQGAWLALPLENRTMQRIEPELPDFKQMQQEEEEAARLSSQCMPFFYWHAMDDHLDILVI